MKRKKSSDSSSDDNASGSHKHSKKLKRKKEKSKKEKKEAKEKERKEKKKRKKEKKERKKKEADQVSQPEKKEEKGKPDANEMESRRKMVPMTKEEWEKQQSVVRREYDEDTGRVRLVKGTGEILEECVSRERQQAINKQATLADGASFQRSLTSQMK